jgi:hypothetical protein
VSAAQPSSGVAAGIFEIDGNLKTNDPTHFDWFGGSFGGLRGVIDPDSCKGGVRRLAGFPDSEFYRDDEWGSSAVDMTTFAKGNKNNDCIAANVDPWGTGPGSGPGKTDITEAYSASYIDPQTRDNWLFLAFATRSNNGDSEMDFEFNAAGLNYDSAGNRIVGNGPNCGRTIGDFIVTINFVGGRSTTVPEVHVWDGTQYTLVSTVPPAGGSPVFYACANDSVVPAPCGAIAPGGETAASYAPLQFAEIAVNLTGLGIDLADFCGKPQSTLSFKTRSSASFTAELKDFKLFPFQLVPSTSAAIQGDLSICADGTTQLCGQATDGAGNPLQYAWSTGETSRCITLSGADLGPGTHPVSLRVSNLFGCSDSSTVQVVVHPLLDISVADAAVCSGENGTLRAVPANGTAPYSYSWSNGATTASITSGSAGEYCVTVTDANGCQGHACGTLTVYSPVQVSVADAAVCAGETGTLSAQVSQGDAPFTFAWSNGATTQDIAVTTAGQYCVTVTDAHGCRGQACGTLTVHAALQVTVPNAEICAGETATLTSSVSNGTAPLTYAWSNGETGESIAVGAAGEYCLTVTDANGCQGRACATLTVHPAVEVSVSDVAVCTGETARLAANVTSGTAPFRFSWSTGQTTESISPTAAGEYCVTVTDAHGCESRACGTLTVYAPIQVSVADQALCFGESATLSANVTDAVAPLSYSWSTGQTTPSISVSQAGEYCVTVTDAHGCQGHACGTLTVHAELQISVPDTTVCWGESGTLRVAAANGTPPFQYAWSNGATTPTITVDKSGEYCVTITDANGCEGRACGTFTELPALKVLMNDTAVCSGETATLTYSTQNGAAPYSVAWSTGSSSSSIDVTEPGEYCVTITDANGCVGRACATVTVYAPLQVSVADRAVCAGESGQLKATVAQGTAPYTYAWSTGATSDAISVSQAGEYCVTVTDAHGCQGQACGTLTVHAQLQVTVADTTVCSGESATLSAAVANGTAPFRFSWSNGATTPSITVNKTGEYCVTVTDANGCEGRACGTFTVLAALKIVVNDAAVCSGEAATLTCSTQNGAAPYSIAWNTGSSSQSITVTEPGQYCVTITDANGCVGRDCATVTVYEALQVSVADRGICAGETGQMKATVSKGTAPYTYAWSTGATSDAISVGQAGQYCVTVTDAHGCKGQACGTLTVYPALQVSVNSVQVCDGQPGTLRATVVNGTAPYKCVWNTGATSESITTTRAGEYCVTVTDANGCQGKACGTLSHPELRCLIQGPEQGCYGKSATFTMGSVITTAKTSAGANAATHTGSRRFGPGLSQDPDVALGASASSAGGRVLASGNARGTSTHMTAPGELSYVECWWSVDDPSVGQIVGPADQPTVTIQFNGMGSLTVTLHVESELGCSNTCSETINVIDCDAANCPRTVGFWGQQCAQKDGGSAKFTVDQLTRIVACVDARSRALNLGAGRAGLDAFCALISTDDMDQRHQAKRQFAGMLANVCTGDLGLVTNNGEWVRLFESTHISCGDFHATTIGELIDEIDALLLALEGRNLDAVKDQYAEIVHCADNMNNGRGILVSCTPGSDPQRQPPPDAFAGMFKTAPNPFRDTMSVLYAVSGSAVQPVSITVYDIAGRRVASLEAGPMAPGQHVATWDGRNTQGTQMSRGVYFVRGVIGSRNFTTRVLLVR